MTTNSDPEKQVLSDEKTYVNRESRFVTAADILQGVRRFEPDVIPHNTMRFDVQLAHVYAMLEQELVTKEQIVSEIRQAIIKAVDATVGAGLDGCPIPGGAMILDEPDSVMMHRETISFDLS